MMMMMTTRTATSNQMKMSPRSSENPTNRITKPQEGTHASQLRPAQTCPQAGKRAGGDGEYLLPSLAEHSVDGGATDLEGLGDLRSPHAFCFQLAHLGHVHRRG